MDPTEICRRIGEEKTKAIFLEMTAEGMRKVLREAKLSTVRIASHTTTRRRNQDWAQRLWRTIAEKPTTGAAATLLFEWLTRTRRPMLSELLSGLGVSHDGGLTDADFMQAAAPEKLLNGGRNLLQHFDRQEVAVYLLFLDATNKTGHFAPLGLEPLLSPAGSASPPAVLPDG